MSRQRSSDGAAGEPLNLPARDTTWPGNQRPSVPDGWQPPNGAEPPASPPVPGELDRGILLAVERLRAHGVETCQSCEGGPGHAYPEPTVDFLGGPHAGWHALSVCLTYGLPVASLQRVWNIEEANEPTGPLWRLVFKRRLHPNGGVTP